MKDDVKVVVQGIYCRPEGFKIRSKADVMKFLNCLSPRTNIHIYNKVVGLEFVISKYATGRIVITERNGDLNNPFNPALTVADTGSSYYDESVEDAIWQLRKYINRL